MNNLKKIGVSIVGLAMLATALPAGAMTAEELAEQIALFQDTLEDLIDEYNELAGEDGDTTPSATIPTACVGISFDTNLSQGASGNDVMCLQAILNLSTDTQVATEGAGSPGNETIYFGPMTHAAVVKFQDTYAAQILTPLGLTAGTGFVGPSTRAVLNSMLEGDEDGITPPMTDLEMILEQLNTLVETVETLADRVAVLEGASGEEGTLTVERNASPRNVEVYAGETEDVASYRLEAEDSDVTVHRMDVYFDVAAGDFRRALDAMAIYVDDEEIASVEINTTTVDREDGYVRFSPLGIDVPADGYTDITIQVTASDNDDALAIELWFDEESVRAIDGAGTTLLVPTTAAASDATARSFDIMGEAAGELEVRRATGSPEQRAVIIDQASDEEVVLLTFTLEATETDIELDQLRTEITIVAAEAINGWFADFGDYDDLDDLIGDVITEIMLYHGDDLLDSGDITELADGVGYVVFEDLDMDLETDELETFEIVAGVQIDEVEYQGFSITADLDADADENAEVGFDVYDADVAIDRDINGLEQHVYVVAPAISNIDTSVSKTDVGDADDAASGSITFDVTAYGAEIRFSSAAPVVTTGVAEAFTVTADTWDLENFEDLTWESTEAEEMEDTEEDLYDDYYYVLDGESAKEFEMTFTTGIAAIGTDRLAVETLMWAAEGSDDWYEFVWLDDFVEDLRTNSLTLYFE
jgi:hypothetical protein